MPKRTDIKSILIIGAGPIVIGQACEFDYAGTQACKALKEEGYRIILANSNPATIMTDPEIADATYIEPLTVEFLQQIIAKEKPDALLPTLGGQTSLNCALALADAGILEKYQVELIGASISAIKLAENRMLFQALMQHIGLAVPQSMIIWSIEEVENCLAKMSLPLIVRPSFSLGGSGAGFANTKEELLALCERAFAASINQEIIIDEALIGWKEFELEVIRDKKDNCIIVCGIENIDPLGIHTGDSITVAPIQTLTDKEYQAMRQAAFAVLRAVGVETGGSNVQFALNPKTGQMVVIEMNPRVSRSSALASKATGFPIAKIAAKLAVGYTLDELKNDITGDQLPASFEPSLDYVVVKIPRFNFEKFPGGQYKLGPQMYSVGEAMAIGTTFKEALQKAMRSLELNQEGFNSRHATLDMATLTQQLKQAHAMQLWLIAEAFHRGMTVEEVNRLTHIDPWFLTEIQEMMKGAQKIKKHRAFNSVYKRIDSCAGEFPTQTAYLYSSYGSVCEAMPSEKEKIIIIGGGPNRIGQGIEFDYCCVHAAKALKAAGYETIMLNCNPETVSTDYDVVDRLYCTPLTLEDVLAIIHVEKPLAVCVQYGGQTPLQLAAGLAAAGITLLGLDEHIIQQTEDRQAFQHFLRALDLKQPKNKCVYDVDAGIAAAREIQFPLIVRPSFVLGGAAMSVVNDEEQLKICLDKAFALHAKHPVLLEQFLQDAIEVDVDVISDGEHVFIPALLEHIEAAGIHSGDSACITPPIHLSSIIQAAIKQQTQCIMQHLQMRGVANIQFAVAEQTIYVLEVNPRASRTLPFLSKATGLPLVQMATQCALGKKLASIAHSASPHLSFYCVKEAVLPFNKFLSTPAILGPEMKSTGEVMGIGMSAAEVYAKAQIAAGNLIPVNGHAWLLAGVGMISDLTSFADKLTELGFKVSSNTVDPPLDCKLVIAIHDLLQPQSLVLKAARYAVDAKICHVTTVRAARMLIKAIAFQQTQTYGVTAMQTYYQQIRRTNHLTHFLTGEELTPDQINKLLQQALQFKKSRSQGLMQQALAGQHLALLFDKPSLRTRFSFTVAMRELGGEVVESVSSTRKVETPEDQARVLSGYCHAVMVRTHADSALINMSQASSIPIINGLSDLHHPCQILADLLTLYETFDSLSGLTLAYIGDGNNILHSLLLLAPRLGVTVHYCCPKERGPDANILARSLTYLSDETGKIESFSTPASAVAGAHAIYTDVWTSMGFEDVKAEHLFSGFQVNESLMRKAHAEAVFMHCLPMERGKEVSESLPDLPCSVIFKQSENRLHVQKALLLHLLT